VKRGEVWTVTGTGFMSKPRPANIFQGDLITLESSVAVIPLTTRMSEVGRIRTSVVLDFEGSPHKNFAMVDKISTVKPGNVGTKVGELTLKEIRAVERSLLGHLGFGSRLPKK
jgi:mRNA-degrading endonuclease toxin of MazEF toxin-antitoxin module